MVNKRSLISKLGLIPLALASASSVVPSNYDSKLTTTLYQEEPNPGKVPEKGKGGLIKIDFSKPGYDDDREREVVTKIYSNTENKKRQFLYASRDEAERQMSNLANTSKFEEAFLYVPSSEEGTLGELVEVGSGEVNEFNVAIDGERVGFSRKGSVEIDKTYVIDRLSGGRTKGKKTGTIFHLHNRPNRTVDEILGLAVANYKGKLTDDQSSLLRQAVKNYVDDETVSVEAVPSVVDGVSVINESGDYFNVLGANSNVTHGVASCIGITIYDLTNGRKTLEGMTQEKFDRTFNVWNTNLSKNDKSAEELAKVLSNDVLTLSFRRLEKR